MVMTRILVVEDSRTQAQQIQFLLEDAGFHVDVAADGVEALEKMTDAAPDIVATDLEMPRMNGLRLVEEIRAHHSNVPVILMTAHGSEEVAAKALRKGAASYVPKTHLDQDLVPAIERIVPLLQKDRARRRALGCLNETHAKFVLPNDPALIPDLVAYLQELLAFLSLGDATDQMRVGVALQEALLNAIQHGNLEVSSALRQDGDEMAYHNQIAARRQQDPYQTRKVYVAVQATPTLASFTIRDEGPGFDPSNLPDPTDPANLETMGGRGLLLIRTFMNQVFHNSRGNEITMVKKKM